MHKKRLVRAQIGLLNLFCLLSLYACGNSEEATQSKELTTQEYAQETGNPTMQETNQETEDLDNMNENRKQDNEYDSLFNGLQLTKSYKGLDQTNPLMTQRFGADPYAMVYEDRVYFYMTADAF